MTRSTLLACLTLGVLLAALTGGCQPTVEKVKYDRLNQQWIDALRENRNLVRQSEQLQTTIGRQNEQISQLLALGPKRLEHLYHVTAVELGRRSGGVDKDQISGDDAVVVYLQPVDRHGHVIKAAGEVTIQLYDLANPPEENLIGEYHWTVEELGKTWAGGFLGSSQFSLTCPWTSGPPDHELITIRVIFTDYLTGRTFTAQKTTKVQLPSPAPQTQPASAPAD